MSPWNGVFWEWHSIPPIRWYLQSGLLQLLMSCNSNVLTQSARTLDYLLPIWIDRYFPRLTDISRSLSRFVAGRQGDVQHDDTDRRILRSVRISFLHVNEFLRLAKGGPTEWFCRWPMLILYDCCLQFAEWTARVLRLLDPDECHTKRLGCQWISQASGVQIEK